MYSCQLAYNLANLYHFVIAKNKNGQLKVDFKSKANFGKWYLTASYIIPSTPRITLKRSHGLANVLPNVKLP